jgi:hypothetical protein
MKGVLMMNNKIVFALATLMFNQIGGPYFLTKNSKQGIKTFVYGIITFGIVAIINTIKGILGGIKLLKMSNEEFAEADKASLIDALPGDLNYKELIALGKSKLSKKKNNEEEEESEEASYEDATEYANEADYGFSANEGSEATYAASAYENALAYESASNNAAFGETMKAPAPADEAAPAPAQANEVASEPVAADEEVAPKKKKKCAIAGVLGIVSILFGIVALLIGVSCSFACGALWGTLASIAIALVGGLFGLIGLIVSIVKTRRPSIAGIIGIILCVLAVAITIVFGIIVIIINAVIGGVVAANGGFSY